MKMLKHKSKSQGGLSRRSFSKGALLATAAAVTPRSAIANSKPELEAQANPQPAPPPVSPMVEAQMTALLSKYGDRLSPEQKADCKRLLIQAQRSSEAMRAFPLDNSNEPATIFRVYRAKKS